MIRVDLVRVDFWVGCDKLLVTLGGWGFWVVLAGGVRICWLYGFYS